MEIQEKIDQRPLKPGGKPFEQGESRPGQFGGGFKVENAEGLTHFPVWFGGKIKLSRLAPFSYFDIITVIRSLRHVVIAEVGDGKNNLVELPADIGELCVKVFDPRRHITHFQNQRLGLLVFACLLERGDFPGNGIAPVLELFHFGKQG